MHSFRHAQDQTQGLAQELRTHTRVIQTLLGSALLALILASAAQAQPFWSSFTLDDMPVNPLVGPVWYFGQGAENPYGLLNPPGPAISGPSPTLGLISTLTFGDGDILEPSRPLPDHVAPSPGTSYISSLSHPHRDNGQPIYLVFSVDRRSTGSDLPSDLATQAALNQAPSDIYKSGSLFVSPRRFVGRLMTPPSTHPAGGQYAGDLNGHFSGPGYGDCYGPYCTQAGNEGRQNTLLLDEWDMGLISGNWQVSAGLPATPPGVGTHDNVDAFEWRPSDPLWSGYVTLYPDLPVILNVPASNIYNVQSGTASGIYATHTETGLHAWDTIDALIVYRNSCLAGSPGCGGPGAQPGVDYAIFSLAPGSPSLTMRPDLGLSAGDLFFTDFSGAFGRYARASELGLRSGGPHPGGGDNIDAADFMCMADLDMVGTVDLNDFARYLQCLTTHCVYDLDLDGVRGSALDLTYMLRNLGCRS
ncbi:MAG: hypothetical protein P8Q97_14190 [Myxococcota bacterium]|nr:hypothetical protein [Myxococcota bacterium]